MTAGFTLSSSDLVATISPLGARLETLRFRGGPNLVLHAKDPAWRDTYGGAIVGPVANRVRGGHVTIEGQTFQMPRNEGGTTALHSGPDGLDQQNWSIVAHAEQSIHLRCTLSDGIGGLPGLRVFDAVYTLAGPCLTLHITATTDAATPIAIAHHPYWRLGRAADHRLQVQATHYLPVDARNIPTGHLLAVAGTAFDHRTPRPIDPETDHNFCVFNAPRTVPAAVATLRGSEGMTLVIESTEPGLQVYAGAHLPRIPGTQVAPLAGVALEPQGWPNAANMSAFPSILARPEAPYKQITRYCVHNATELPH